MEFLILALLGLATFGVTEALGSGDDKSDSSKKDSDKDKKDGDTDKKSPEQELLEAIAKYEADPPKDKRIKISFEMQDRE
jgi:hypothetical protein